jgi:hypothetical protein
MKNPIDLDETNDGHEGAHKPAPAHGHVAGSRQQPRRQQRQEHQDQRGAGDLPGGPMCRTRVKDRQIRRPNQFPQVTNVRDQDIGHTSG